MYEEKDRHIKTNWISVFIKLLLIILILVVIFWLIIRIKDSKSTKTNTTTITDTEYNNNLDNMKNGSLKYFDNDNLPTEVGSSKKITLKELLSKNLVNDYSNVCDGDNSYAEATKTTDEEYTLRVSLTCGDKSNSIITSIKKTKNNEEETNTEDIKTEEEEVLDAKGDPINNSTTSKSNTSSSSSYNSQASSNTSSSNKTTTTTTTTTTRFTLNLEVNCSGCCTENCSNIKFATRYYEFYKWSDWKLGYSSEADAENKQEQVTTYLFCKKESQTYYGSCFISKGSPSKTINNEVTYTLPSDATNVTITNKSYLDGYDYQAYMDNCTKNGNCSASNVTVFRNSSLKSNNFTFNISNPYLSNGVYKSNVTINYLNANGVTPYCAGVNCSGYFAPYKVEISYKRANTCVRDVSCNASGYCNYEASDPQTETVWVHRVKEYMYSTSTYLEGYTYTGEYVDR